MIIDRRTLAFMIPSKGPAKTTRFDSLEADDRPTFKR